jgi:hypothetical protein
VVRSSQHFQLELAKESREAFTELHHAVLFGLLAKALCERSSEGRGEAVVLEATRRYGEEWGRRMSQGAAANGHALDMDDYIAYSEIATAPGAMEQKLSVRDGCIYTRVTRCPWCAAWREEGLMEWARLYCREIDESLVRGFNPRLELEVRGTMSNGSPSCDFVFHGAGAMLKIAWRKAVKPGRGARRPWDFHVAHLLSTMERVFVERLGDEGAAAIGEGIDSFGERFGQAALARLRELKKEYEPTGIEPAAHSADLSR